MGLFLISQIPWGSNAFEFDTLRCPRPLQICFPGYQMPELLEVHPGLSTTARCLTFHLKQGPPCSQALCNPSGLHMEKIVRRFWRHVNQVRSVISLIWSGYLGGVPDAGNTEIR